MPLPAEQFTNLSMDSNSPRYAPDFISGSSQLVKASLAGALGDPAVAGSLFNTGTFDGFSMSRRPFSTTAATVGAALNALVGADKSQFEISVNGSAYVNVDRYGNTSAASIPIALDELVRADQVEPGDYIVLVAFGGGLTWGANLLRW